MEAPDEEPETPWLDGCRMGEADWAAGEVDWAAEEAQVEAQEVEAQEAHEAAERKRKRPSAVALPVARTTPAAAAAAPAEAHGQRSKKSLATARQYLALLESGDARSRPRLLDDATIASRQIFVERPVLKRRKGADRWVTSGGRQGATQIWLSDQQGLLKRYGQVMRSQKEGTLDGKLRFAQYTMISRRATPSDETMQTDGDDDEEEEAEEDRSVGLWVLQPAEAAGASTRKARRESYSAKLRSTPVPAVGGPLDGLRVSSRARAVSASRRSPVPPSLVLRATGGQKFLSFEAEPTINDPDGMELGAVVRAAGGTGGVKLTSTQGDFAEWHRVADGQGPLSEGEVVGFRHGRISRNTRNCAMLGVVTRKAVVEGSAPPPHEQHLYDTVAYQGIVPVRVSRRSRGQSCECPAPHAGQVLMPSGRNDGTAVLAPATEGVSRVGIVLDSAQAQQDMAAEALRDTDGGHSLGGGWVLMQAVVVPPAETVAARTGLLRRVLMVLVTLIVSIAVVMDLLGGQQQPRAAGGSSSSSGDSGGGSSGHGEGPVHVIVQPVCTDGGQGDHQPEYDGASVMHRTCGHTDCPPDLPLRSKRGEYDAVIFLPGLQISSCGDGVDWKTCDVFNCCERTCEGVDCPAGFQRNSCTAYMPSRVDRCYGDLTNVTMLRSCDVETCCYAPMSDVA
jgi:hypothetical protein